MVRFGRFAVDSLRRQLVRDGQAVHLTPKAYDLLAVLVNEAPRLLPKAELHDRLWPGTFVCDATLVGLVKELRRALEDQDPRAPIIRTAHRVGYAFCPQVDRTPANASGSWHWIVVGDRRIFLNHGENLIGRDPGAIVWLDAASVSRRHARLIVTGSDVLLEDLGSKNGTMVDDRQLKGSITLRDGNCIRLGQVSVVYRASSSGMATETDDYRP